MFPRPASPTSRTASPTTPASRRRSPARWATGALLAVLALAPGAFAQDGDDPAGQFDLPLRHLTLYSSGVGHFTHTGAVPGGDATFSFSAAQLNDVLKSLLVRGANGSVAVSYPGQEPVEQRLAGFGIDLNHASSLPQLMRQLRGVPVSLTAGTESFTGRLLGVEERTSVDDGVQTTETWVNLVTDTMTMHRIALDEVTDFAIRDEGLKSELGKALGLLGSTRQRDAKPLTLSFAEPAEQAAVSYLLETPLWKLSYRLDLTQDEPLLQGWAIVDNTTDADWAGINVTLVSGRPVSFIQNLYSPEYLQRPVVQPERYAGLKPQQYGQGVMLGKQLTVLKDEREVARRQTGRSSSAFGGVASAPAAEAADMDVSQAMLVATADGQSNRYFAGAELQMASSGVTPNAAAGDLGDLFAYHIDQPVTVPRGGSAMLPIVNETVTADPLSIYNASVQQKHPMRGVRLTNTTDLKLDAGPVTVLDDGAYAGDAQLGFIAPGDDRLLSYGLDLELTVDANTQAKTTFVTANISRGVLVLTHETRYTQTYEARNAAGDDRDLLIEHPRHHNRKLLSPNLDARDEMVEDIEKTDALYRLPLAVPAGETAKLEVVESEPRVQHVRLVQQAADQLAAYAANGRYPADVRDAIKEAVKRQRAAEQTHREIQAIEKLNAQITAEQDRLRRNMNSLDRNSALYRRYVTKLDTQETQFEEHAEQLDALRTRLADQQKALADYLESLDAE